ncbi:MAG: hypothetical protein ACRD50_10085 [Candidatus Acidiferrales bacterium]
MPLPETIPVRYTEEEAEYLSLRPVVKQTFRAAELVDMVLSVAGKNPERIQKILHSGTVVFHSYRYWWTGIEASAEELSSLLSAYPDANPERRFEAASCTAVIIEWQGNPPRHSAEIRREAASRKKIFRTRSFWDCLVAAARPEELAYREYSYGLRGDIFALKLSAEEAARIERDARRLAARALEKQLAGLGSASSVLFVCPRRGPPPQE